jgi:hypothetical protein
VKPGDLVRHIEFELIGIILQIGWNDFYRVHWAGGTASSEDWYSKCEMDVI